MAQLSPDKVLAQSLTGFAFVIGQSVPGWFLSTWSKELYEFKNPVLLNGNIGGIFICIIIRNSKRKLHILQQVNVSVGKTGIPFSLCWAETS